MVKKVKNYANQTCEKAVVFARVSSHAQEKGASIDAQLASVYDYCKDKNLKIIKEYILTESSTQGDRKQYREMLNYVSQHPDKLAIVVNCVDRLQRSYKDTPALDELRKSDKLEIHFLKEKMVLHKDSGSMEILFWNLNVLMANSYVLCIITILGLRQYVCDYFCSIIGEIWGCGADELSNRPRGLQIQTKNRPVGRSTNLGSPL